MWIRIFKAAAATGIEGRRMVKGRTSRDGGFAVRDWELGSGNWESEGSNYTSFMENIYI